MHATVTTFDPTPFLRALDGDRETFVSLATDFLQTFDDSVDAITSAADARDMPVLYERCHGFKGALAIFRADELVQALDAVERSCRRGDVAVDMRAVAIMVYAAEAFRIELLEYCDDTTAAAAGA
jgi:HPt (histidine-containing phosphotransfer) domain-containing protein